MAEISDVFHRISKLQFHYWFSDKTHTMDALVYNKCERELLELTRAVSKLCGVSIKMETEPSGKGGLKTWLTLLPKTPRKTPALKVALVQVGVALQLTAPSNNISESIDALLANLLADQEGEELPRELREQAITQLRQECLRLQPYLEQNSVVRKRKSNFYTLLQKYSKVKSFSVALADDGRKPIAAEQQVMREAFKAFTIKSNAVAPQLIEQAQVEIISPVLVKGNHKWRGMYQGGPISFVMKSDDFMTMVQSGKVEFKSGSSISCRLQIEKRMNSVGVERIVGYTILGVHSYTENGKTTEAPTVEAKPKQPAVSRRQLDLFGN